MTKKKLTTKSKIISAAWELFYKEGYDNVTVDDIIAASATSKGSFYHYFNGKDALFGTLSTLFDDKYEELEQLTTEQSKEGKWNSIDKLLFLNSEMHKMIEATVDRELLAYLYSSQLITKGERHLLDQNRFYYRLINKIIAEGQRKGEITVEIAPQEIARIYALSERAFIYEWCISQGSQSLAETSGKYLPGFLEQFRLK